MKQGPGLYVGKASKIVSGLARGYGCSCMDAVEHGACAGNGRQAGVSGTSHAALHPEWPLDI